MIDRVKWENTGIDIPKLLSYVESDSEDGYRMYLRSFLTTDLQKKNLDLVCKASYTVLRECYENQIHQIQ